MGGTPACINACINAGLSMFCGEEASQGPGRQMCSHFPRQCLPAADCLAGHTMKVMNGTCSLQPAAMRLQHPSSATYVPSTTFHPAPAFSGGSPPGNVRCARPNTDAPSHCTRKQQTSICIDIAIRFLSDDCQFRYSLNNFHWWGSPPYQGPSHLTFSVMTGDSSTPSSNSPGSSPLTGSFTR